MHPDDKCLMVVEEYASADRSNAILLSLFPFDVDIWISRYVPRQIGIHFDHTFRNSLSLQRWRMWHRLFQLNRVVAPGMGSNHL